MKQLLLFLITLYQVLISPLLHHVGVGGCKYPVSCSEYTKQKIDKEGVIRGIVLGLRRFSTCHPFASYSTR